MTATPTIETPPDPKIPTDPAVLKRLRLRKWLVFGAMFVVWLAADYFSKEWADQTLANLGHPQPIRITEGEAGKTLGQVIAARYGLGEADAAQTIATSVQPLSPAGKYTGETKPFDRQDPASQAAGFYVFWRGSPELAPRRIARNDERTLGSWLRDAFPKVERGEIGKATVDAVDDLTLATWMPEVFRKLSPEGVAELATSGQIHPIDVTSAPSPSEVVAVGKDYLLTDYEVPVMGSWFKLIYAENPSAAFGFMKGVSPSIRTTLFMILTCIAFVVIGLIVYRLPVHGWLVAGCFGAILSGAAGNFIDRVRFGYVIDFIDMTIGSLNWPTYNVADIAISVGVVVLMLDLMFNKNSLLASKKDKERAAAKAAAKKAAQRS